MQRYLDQGVLEEQSPGFLLIDRETSEVPSRKGLMVALDLEAYDYTEGSTSLIRATEGTILDRLPQENLAIFYVNFSMVFTGRGSIDVYMPFTSEYKCAAFHVLQTIFLKVSGDNNFNMVPLVIIEASV